MPIPERGRAGKALRAIDDGDGTYHVDTRMTPATHWIINVDVVTAHAQATIQRGLEVKRR